MQARTRKDQMPFALLFRLPSSVFRSICQPSIPLSLHLNDHISFVRLRNLLTSRLRKSRYLSKSLNLGFQSIVDSSAVASDSFDPVGSSRGR